MAANKTSRTRWMIWYGLPLVVGVLLLLWSGAEGARYEKSWWALQHTLRFLAPELAPPGDGSDLQLTASFYQLNLALRRVAHIVLYALLALLTVRAIQGGRPRLKAASLWATLGLGLLYTGLDEWHRATQPNRHAKWLDLGLNLAGVATVVIIVPLYFSLKQAERRMGDEKTRD